jgi:hypothetical protein
MFRYVKAVIIGVAFFVGLYLGSSYEENKHREILASTQQEYIAKLDEITKGKDATINLLLKDMATTDAVQSALDKRISRLQYNINSGNKAIMQHTDRVTAESVVQCRQLLSEGAELHGEGVKVLRDTNRRLEAIINIHKEQNSP